MSEALAARRRAAETLLRDALRLDVTRLLCSEVEARLRTRPHFRARFPRSALAQLRSELDARPSELAAAAWEKLGDLRVWYGAQPGEEGEEAAAVAAALAPFPEAVAELLRVYGFPDDRAPDDPGERGVVDLEATYRVDYRPSPQVEWAWRQLRALDTARNQLADGAPRGSFELAFHLPEALADEDD